MSSIKRPVIGSLVAILFVQFCIVIVLTGCEEYQETGLEGILSTFDDKPESHYAKLAGEYTLLHQVQGAAFDDEATIEFRPKVEGRLNILPNRTFYQITKRLRGATLIVDGTFELFPSGQHTGTMHIKKLVGERERGWFFSYKYEDNILEMAHITPRAVTITTNYWGKRPMFY